MSLRDSHDMRQAFKLPMVPGVTSGDELLRRNYRKAQTLANTGEGHLVVKDVPMSFESTSANVNQRTAMGLTNTGGGTMGTLGTRTAASTKFNETAASLSAEPLDRQVLRFFGYFTEGVTESAVEKGRVRKVTLCYFLEDDTLSVSEPRVDNSGIGQGALVKRHRIPKQDGTGTVSYEDLCVGATVAFYGRSYLLVDCDKFTREWMAAMGLDMGDADGSPDDEYTRSRQPKGKPAGLASVQTVLNSAGMKVKLSAPEVRATQQFLQKDRQVLRCKAVWDDTQKLYGARRHFTIYYFLADDTIEVVEQLPSNSGHDPFPSFCRRQKVIKPLPGTTKTPVANAALTVGGREGQESNTYKDTDLMVGSTVVVVGRPFLIYAWDRFTQQHMRSVHGITGYQPIEVADPPKPATKREPPPYNGFGSEEDSLSAWKSLEARPPKKDMSNYRKYGDSVVKYALRLDNGIANDEGRRFVLSCFIADSTIQIFETVQRNSGIVGGKFLQRQKVTNPETGKAFLAADFHVGQRVVVNGFKFSVFGTDDRSMSFMEENSSAFPKANINAVVERVQAMMLSKQTGLYEALLHAEHSDRPNVDLQDLADIFGRLELDVSEQEVLCVLRYFDRNGETGLTYAELTARLLSSERPCSDARPWQEIFASRTTESTATLSSKDRVDAQAAKVSATCAAYAARKFLELYNARRTLFQTEFKFITDYSVDEKIGEPEFRTVCTEKLTIGFTQQQLDALCQKLFPIGSRRVTLEEFFRLLNNTSNLSHNMAQIRERRA